MLHVTSRDAGHWQINNIILKIFMERNYSLRHPNWWPVTSIQIWKCIFPAFLSLNSGFFINLRNPCVSLLKNMKHQIISTSVTENTRTQNEQKKLRMKENIKIRSETSEAYLFYARFSVASLKSYPWNLSQIFLLLYLVFS